MRGRVAPRLLLAPLLGLALAASASAPAHAQADGKALFEKNCQKCHGADGQAATPAGKKMKVPTWTEPVSADEAVHQVRTNKKHVPVSKKVSDADLQQARARGLNDSDIVETIANVALNIFTNYVNHVAQTIVDFPEVKPGNGRVKATCDCN